MVELEWRARRLAMTASRSRLTCLPRRSISTSLDRSTSLDLWRLISSNTARLPTLANRSRKIVVSLFSRARSRPLKDKWVKRRTRVRKLESKDSCCPWPAIWLGMVFESLASLLPSLLQAWELKHQRSRSRACRGIELTLTLASVATLIPIDTVHQSSRWTAQDYFVPAPIWRGTRICPISCGYHRKPDVERFDYSLGRR